MDKILACGVIGAGVFGGHHAGKYAANPRVRFAGVYDPHPERAQALAEKHGGQGFASLGALLDSCDAVSVCSPAAVHAEQVNGALNGGCHVLVEKPLATTATAARALVDKAAHAGLQLHAGHQERFVAKAAGLMDAPAPKFLSARRFGAPGARGTDVSVVMDLMIHDLDLALRLIGAPVASVRAEGDSDEARAVVGFEGGAVAEFAAGRRAAGPDRTTRIEWAEGAADIDWVKKTIGNASPYALDPGFADTPEAKDSLGANVAAFVAACLDGTPAMAPGAEAAEAAALAERIEAEGWIRNTGLGHGHGHGCSCHP